MTSYSICLSVSNLHYNNAIKTSQVVLVEKNPSASADDIRDMGSVSGLGRSPGEGNGNLLQYSCLENSTAREAWWATVSGVAKSWTRLSAHTQCHQDPSVWLQMARFPSLWPNNIPLFINIHTTLDT